MRDEAVKAIEALALPLPHAVEFPDLQVRLEGDCGYYKSFPICIPLSRLALAIRQAISYEDSDKRSNTESRLYWPQRGKKRVQRLLLLLLAESYPRPLSVSDLRGMLERRGVKCENLRKYLYRLYYYYRAVERVGYGLYRLSSEYYEALVHEMPDWLLHLACMSQLPENYDADICDEAINAIKAALLIFAIDNFTRSQKVANSLKESQINSSQVSALPNNKYKKSSDGPACTISKDKLLNILREEKPALFDALQDDREVAAELIGILYARAKRGRPYIAATDAATLHMAIVDEARSVWGESSSIAGTLDWDGIRDVVLLLKSSGIVFAARYGREYKIRLDKYFESLLDEVGVVTCATQRGRKGSRSCTHNGVDGLRGGVDAKNRAGTR